MGSVERRKTHTRSFSTVVVATSIAVLAFAAIGTAGVTPGVNTGGTQNSHHDGPITPPTYVEGQIVVKPSSDTVSIEAMALGFDATVQKQLIGFGAYLLEVGPGEDLFAVSAALEGSPGVEYAHPNYLINPLHPVQGSYPFSDEQVSGDFRGQLPASTLKLAQAHGTTTGAGIKVGVIDGGVDYTHPELSSHVSLGYDVVDEDSDPMDEPGGPASGHGTFVAGIINLVAPDAEIRAYRVTNEIGYGDGYGLAEAIQRAVLDGCDVINISVVMMAEHMLVSEVVAFARSQGVVVVVAAGNEGEETVAFPATDPNTIAVAAIDSLDRIADFSSYGSSIDVCAPGTWIYSTYQSGGWAWWSGTSFAAPFVAGQAALLKAVYPTATPEQIADVISNSAVDLSTVNPGYPGMIGTGLVDPPQAFSLYASLDFASISPDTLQFAGYQNDEVLRSAGAYLFSGTGPTPYTAEVLQTGDLFASLAGSRSGVSNDTVTVLAEVMDLAPGTYYNTIRFTVAGVTQPVDLVVSMTVESQQFGSISPDTILFVGPSGIFTFAPIEDSAYLTSDNAPAQFVATVTDSVQFIYLLDSVGLTDAYVGVGLLPSMILAPGTYYNHVTYTIEGVADPVDLTVAWEVTDETPGEPDSVWVQPSELTFIVDENDLAMGPVYSDVQTVMIHSINEPVPFVATTLDTINAFARLLDTLGMTGDSAIVQIVAGSSFTEGTYYNTIQINAQGIAQSAYLTVRMIVTGDTVGSGLSTVTVSPYAQAFNAPIDTPYVETGAVYLSTTKGASAYSAAVLGTADFIVLNDTTGMTEDSFYFEVNTGAGLPEGLYTDTIAFWVHGAAFNPQLAIVYLTTGDSVGTGYGIVTLTPTWFGYTVIENRPFAIDTSLFISNSKGQYDYTAGVVGPNDFTTLHDTAGLTETYVNFTFESATGLPAGLYFDSVAFLVNNSVNATNPKHAVIIIQSIADTSGGGGGGTDSVWTSWDTVVVNYNYGSLVLLGPVSTFVYSTNQPSMFSAWVTSGGPIFASLVDSIGTTGDSVQINTDPTGLAPGTYYNDVHFGVSGITEPGVMVVRFNILDSLGGTNGSGPEDVAQVSLGNYPNPFNPETNISFSIPQATRVTLSIYNILGQKVRSLIDQEYSAGEHTVVWDGSNDHGGKVASGVYLYRIQAGEISVTRKMMMLK